MKQIDIAQMVADAVAAALAQPAPKKDGAKDGATVPNNRSNEAPKTLPALATGFSGKVGEKGGVHVNVPGYRYGVTLYLPQFTDFVRALPAALEFTLGQIDKLSVLDTNELTAHARRQLCRRELRYWQDVLKAGLAATDRSKF